MNENVLIDRSTNVVTITILVAGTAIDSAISVQSVMVSRTANQIPYAQVVLTDGDSATQDFALSNEDTFKPGEILTIQAGYQADDETIFEGIILRHGIKALAGQPSLLKVECSDAVVKMNAQRKSAYYAEVKDSDIMADLIETYGLTADVEDTPFEHKEVIKYRATDWDFMALRAEANGQLIFAKDGEVSVKAPDFGQDQKMTLTYGSTITEFELEMDAESQLSGVTTQSWNFKDQEIEAEESETDELQGIGDLTTADLSSILNESPEILYHNGELESEALKSWADATMLKSQMARVRGRVRILGFADIYPGDMVELAGVGTRFNGKAFVTGIMHQIYKGSWTTDIQLGLPNERFASKAKVSDLPASGLMPAIHGLHVGIVVGLEEEDNARGYGRILVKIPQVKESENSDGKGIWARLCNVFAGDSYGMVFRPDIDDEVVLGFINGDPNHAIILGAMHSDDRPAPIEALDDNPEKGIVTNTELKLLFNDEVKSIEVSTESGNTILLSEEDGGILIEDENGNSTTLNSDGITIKSAADIIMEASGDVKISGTNVEIEASAGFVAKGATTELDGSATTTVKGGIVQIN